MSDDEDAMLRGPLPRNMVERTRILAIRSAEDSARENCTDRTIYDLIYTIGLSNGIRAEFPISYRILLRLFAERYPIDENESDRIDGITDFAIRLNPMAAYYQNIGEPHRDQFELHTLKGNVEQSISWLANFEGPTTYRAKLISAMKLAVHSHPLNLERGRETWAPADLFIQRNDERGLLPLRFIKNQFHQWIFREEDVNFKEVWIDYYNRHNPRICHRCHPEMLNQVDADGWSLA
jgi:hypothetical protein